jgi:uncharacterized membrane protein HdeD (DUF308 family)
MQVDQSYQQSWATIISSKPLRDHWKGMTASGIWFVFVGLGVIVLSTIELIPISTLMGATLILAGAELSTQALIVRHWRGFFPMLAFGLVYAAFGFINLTYPIKGVAIASLLLIGFFVISSVVKFVLAGFLHPARGWRHITTAATISAFFVFLLMLLDITMPWVPGFLLGVELILNAWWMIALASISRTVIDQA